MIKESYYKLTKLKYGSKKIGFSNLWTVVFLAFFIIMMNCSFANNVDGAIMISFIFYGEVISCSMGLLITSLVFHSNGPKKRVFELLLTGMTRLAYAILLITLFPMFPIRNSGL